MTIDMIELERKRLKTVSVAKLCQAAGVSTRCYERIRLGTRRPRGDTIARLTAALSQLRRGDGVVVANSRDAVERAIFRMLLILLAQQAGIDPAEALNHKPQRKATADKDWHDISRIRDVACYMLNTVAGMRNSDIARAAGVTPPAIHSALKKMEDKREDHPELEQIFVMLEKAVQS